ncbi:MAG: right-handed parallel beta-helix repeat-containing protein [Clostridiaceae bacterium]|nr:right-handed parallel beta-helix repeat-containing protein [Clostridiaceae bacterium]
MRSSKRSLPMWKTTTFGQSTDLNFHIGVLPGKTGVNDVRPFGETVPLVPETPAPAQDITIESRGGKIQPVHDGLTFYYTEIPAIQNFILSADITLLQLGPEDHTAPNGQEACGIMIRDVNGPQRQDPFIPGYEEYPAASNMVMLDFVAAGRTSNCPVSLQAAARYGVFDPSGNSGVSFITRMLEPDFAHTSSQDGSGQYRAAARLSLERNDTGFLLSYQSPDQEETKTFSFDDPGIAPNIMAAIDSGRMYAGFFAARNAQMEVRNISLTFPSCTSAALTPPQRFHVPAIPALIRTSPDWCNNGSYCVSVMTSVPGRLTIKAGGRTECSFMPVTPGVQTQQMIPVISAHTVVSVIFTTEEGAALCEEMTVTRGHFSRDLYVSPSGSDLGSGCPDDPLSMKEAVQRLIPGGTLHMLPGVYPPVRIPMTASGTPTDPKKIRTEGQVIIRPSSGHDVLFTLDSNYWDISGLELDGKGQFGISGFFIHGSHNVISDCRVHHTMTPARDAGFMVTTIRPQKAFWPSYNRLIRCESYENRDKTDQNADGFACRTGAGDGNCFINCLSHDNSDDGFDLYNNINDGPNGPVLLENCIAYRNHCNGFKLGGEGREAAHTVHNCISFENGLNGFSDNFNPGQLLVEYNTAYDNGQYNFLFRPSPYKKGPDGEPVSDCILIGNLSFYTGAAGEQDGRPRDYVSSLHQDGNRFIL